MIYMLADLTPAKRLQLDNAVAAMTDESGEAKRLAEAHQVDPYVVYRLRQAHKRKAGRIEPRERLRPEFSHTPPRLCFCSGCYEPAQDGKFCIGHSVDAMTSRVMAQMPEASARKLLRGRA